MKKYSPLIILLVLFGAILGMSEHAESIRQLDHDRRAKADTEAAAESNAHESIIEIDNMAYRAPGWIKLFALPEGDTFWAVALTLFAVAWQSVETRAAAEGSLLSAKAAKENIEAFMSKERARISCIGISGPVVNPIRMIESDGTTGLFTKIFLKFINDGETMASNVRAFGAIDFFSKDQMAKPSVSLYTLNAPKHIRNASIDNPCEISLCPVEGGSDVVIQESLLNDLESGSLQLHVQGNIAYHDIFGKGHNTPFHHVYTVRSEGNWPEERGWTDISPAND